MLQQLRVSALQSAQSLRSGKAFVIFLLSLFITAIIPTASAAGYNFKYSKLLDNCVESLEESGFSAEQMKLVRKIDAGPRYKLWIDIAAAKNGTESAPFRAYCEGRHNRGDIEVLAFAEGQWRSGKWTADTEAVVKENYVKQ